MASNNSPIELVDAPEFSVLKLSDCTETENGSLVDDDVTLSVTVNILFQTSDRLRKLVRQCYRVPISRFSEELIVAEMLGKVGIPESIITGNPSFVSLSEEILSAGQYMACHRPPEQTLLVLEVKAVVPVNRLPDDDVIESVAGESEFRTFVSVRDRNNGDGIDQTDDEDHETHEDEDEDETDDDDYETDNDDDEEEDNENANEIFLEGWEWIKCLEEVRVKDEPSFNTECPICLEELEVGSEASRLPCLHLFHGECVFEWLNTSSSKNCPLCRYQLPS